MKPVVKLLIEAGIIDRDTVLAMEKWGNLEAGSVDLVGTKRPSTKKDRDAFAESVSELLDIEREDPPKETRLEVRASAPFMVAVSHGLNFPAVWDELGRLICEPSTKVVPEDWIMIGQSHYLVDAVTKLYQGEIVAALQLEVSPAKIREV